MEDRGINNEIESVEVPPGFKLTLFSEGNYTGVPYVVYGSLRWDLEGPKCHVIDLPFKNKASSLRLERYYH